MTYQHKQQDNSQFNQEPTKEELEEFRKLLGDNPLQEEILPKEELAKNFKEENRPTNPGNNRLN